LELSFAYAQLEWHNKLAAEYAAFLGLELLLGERAARSRLLSSRLRSANGHSSSKRFDREPITRCTSKLVVLVDELGRVVGVVVSVIEEPMVKSYESLVDSDTKWREHRLVWLTARGIAE
jgi:hypothetical protein